jgi:transposase
VTQPAPLAVLTSTQVFCAALELSVARWKIAFFASGEQRRIVTIESGDWQAFDAETAKARQRFGVEDNVKLVTCYEAGRDGFWIHRELAKKGVRNLVVDPSSILVDRRARRSKTDTQDALSLMTLLARHLRGDKDVWRVVRVPTVEEEDARRLHRERERLTKERTGHITRLKSLLALLGLRLKNPRHLEKVEEDLPEALRAEAKREVERLALVDKQMEQLAAERAEAVSKHLLPNAEKIEQLEQLKALGPTSATILVSELFGWRTFKNGKQVGSCAGLAPTPYASGEVKREQGISKAGNRRVRTLCVEIAWVWLRYQPESTLAKWFNQRFAKGSGRSRRVGIVALARKLLIALWHYLEHGLVPEGAVMKA